MPDKKLLIFGEVGEEIRRQYEREYRISFFYTTEIERNFSAYPYFSMPFPDLHFDAVLVETSDIFSQAAFSQIKTELLRVCKGAFIIMPPARDIFGISRGAAPAPLRYTPPKDASLRVLVLSYMYPSLTETVNGIFVYDQVKALLQRGDIDIRVVTGKPFWMWWNPRTLIRAQREYGRQIMNLKAEIQNEGWNTYRDVPVCYLPYRVHRVLQLLSLQSDSYVRSVMQVIDEIHGSFPFDIVHAHTSYLDGAAAKAVSERFSVPYIITEHTGPFSMLTRTPRMQKKTYGAIRGAAEVWGVSEAQRDIIRSHFKDPGEADVREKVGVMYNGIKGDDFSPPAKRSRDGLSLMYVGYLVPIKNIDLLIEAFRRLAGDYPEVTLKIVGDGELESQLKKQAAETGVPERIFFLGRVSHAEIPKLLFEECDILVLPSKAESFGMVVAEAAMAGIPSVISRCGGAESVVVDDRIGEVCDADDTDALEQALRRAIDRYWEFDSEYIAAYAREKFDFSVISEKIDQKYREILGNTERTGEENRA